MKQKVIKPKFVTEPNEEIIIGGCMFTPLTEKKYGKNINDKDIILNQKKVKSKIMQGLLEEILEREQEIVYDVKRFNGVSTSHIKRVFEKYGIVNETKF